MEISARGPEALRAYKKALKDGKASDHRVPVMIVGQDRSGKTSLKKSLKGELFDPEENSTLGIEVDPSLYQVTTEVWTARENIESSDEKVAMDGKFEHHAARFMQRDLMEQQSGKENKKRKLHSDEPTREPKRKKENVSQIKVSHSTSRKDTRKTLAVVNKSNDNIVKSNIKKLPEAAINDGGFSKMHDTPEHKRSSPNKISAVPDEVQKLLHAELEEFDDTIEFVFWDFAGQSVFYTTHVLFLSQIAMYILTHDLSKELDAKAVPLVKCDMYERVVSDSKCERTNMDFVHHWLMSIHAFSAYPESISSSNLEHLPPKLPAVFLVGTHADKCTNPRKVPMEILSNLEGKSYEGHLVREVFTVDNTRSGGQEGEDEAVKRLQQAILQVARQLPHVKKDIPLR